MQFLKEDSTDLLTYARNVNAHFANKKCQDVIVAARNLMTSEMHDTVKVPERQNRLGWGKTVLLQGSALFAAPLKSLQPLSGSAVL